MSRDLGEMFCKVCGKSSKDDNGYFNRKNCLCNRHNLQMKRHGKIIYQDENRKRYNKVCDICGDTESCQYRIWNTDDIYKGKVLCSKHYTQLRNYGKIKDEFPASHTEKIDRVCDICGSNHDVIYHDGTYYCRRHYSQVYDLGGLKDITIFDRNEFYIEDDVAYIVLRNGKNENIAEVKIDVEDLEKVIKYKWKLGTWGYAENKELGLMQRFILNEYDEHRIPDHDNRDKLDNRKLNLKISDKSMNAVNCDMRSNNKSGVTGVSWNRNAKSWRAYINYKGKRIELGHRKNKIDAIILRLNAENKYYPNRQPQKEMFEKYGVELYEE